MGLDISYHSNVIEDINGELRFDYNNTFEYQLGSLKPNTNYVLTDKSENGSFGAGSYSGYNSWRNELAVVAGYGSADNVWKDFNPSMRYHKLKKLEGDVYIIKPFYELIFFSDCEGSIGPEVSKKLYKDFVDFEEKAKKHNSYRFYELYKRFKEAFRVASENGFVHFH